MSNAAAGENRDTQMGAAVRHEGDSFYFRAQSGSEFFGVRKRRCEFKVSLLRSPAQFRVAVLVEFIAHNPGAALRLENTPALDPPRGDAKCDGRILRVPEIGRRAVVSDFSTILKVSGIDTQRVVPWRCWTNIPGGEALHVLLAFWIYPPALLDSK